MTINNPGTTASSQRTTLAQELRNQGSVTTLHARETMGIMAPAPRIKELKERGWDIRTMPITAIDSAGVRHEGIAKYVLISEPKRKAPDSDQTEEDLDNATE